MPVFQLQTNVSKVPDGFLSETTDFVADMLGKPASYVMVVVRSGEQISMAGSNDPCGVVNLGSIGAVGKGLNNKHTQKISAYLNEKLGISPGRLYCVFQNIPASDCGLNGNTFG